MSYMRYFIFGAIFLGLTQITLQSFAPNENTIETQLDFIYCEYPSYINGTSGQTCNIVEHDDTYADDSITFIPSFTLWNFSVNGGFFSGGTTVNWTAITPSLSIPTGQINHSWDSMASGLGRLYNIGVLVLAVLFPVGDLTALLDEAVIATVIGLLAILYLVIGFSVYKLVLPFV